uniref:LITAF domain-containing protein n=1 Tax=Graphocephala atropunctata TaxID=36148 RepID=A0A1B6MMI9_9HEMI
MNSKNAPPPTVIFQPQRDQAQPRTITVMLQTLGPESCNLNCPSCNASIATRVQKDSTTKTHLLALILCLIFCPCVCIPYCCDCGKATNHYCPACGAFLGTYDH